MMIPILSGRFQVFVAIFALPTFAVAQGVADAGPPSVTNPNWFPFPISVADGTASPISLAGLNAEAAGSKGFLKVKGQQLVDSDGKVVRLFGTNFCGISCFPSAEEAVSVAAYLAKNGVNVVRLHHMDNGWSPESTLIADNEKTTLNLENLDKLDRLAAELMKNGIFLNINLHCSRTYHGNPAGAPDFSKGVDFFHPPFIEAFKSYARQLLTHVNPYTKRAYKDEPGVAIVEMNNENTLVQDPWWIAKLPEPFFSEIHDRFTAYLKKKYPTTADLQAVWGINDGSSGPNVIADGSFAKGMESWRTESGEGAACTATPIPGEPGLRWTSTASGANQWALQLSQSGLALSEESTYKLTFRARSAVGAKVQIIGQNAAAPWAQIGLTDYHVLTPEWKTYTIYFSPKATLPGPQNRIVFSLLNSITSLDLVDVNLAEVPPGYLKPDQTFEADNIPIPDPLARKIVLRDFFGFLAQHELDHAREMKRFLKEEVGVKSLVSHSSLLFGGIAGARREYQVSDLVDTHGYWHHPSFPNVSWDMGDWNVDNTSQLGAPDGGTLSEIAMQRPFGKPYSVSEYDIPAPIDSAAETFPLFAAMAGLQDWSAIYHFNFKNGLPYATERMNTFFDLPGQSAKQALMPLAALAFRENLIPALPITTTLATGEPAIFDYVAEKAGQVWSSWREVWGRKNQTGMLAWSSQVGYDLSDDAVAGMALRPATSAAASALVVKAEPGAGTFSLAAPRCLIASGPHMTPVVHPAGIVITFPSAAASTLMLVPLDKAPLATSEKLWLCAVSRSENPDMVWNAARTSVGNQWGNGPTLTLGVNATVTLPEGTSWKVEALSSTGQPMATVAEKTRSFSLDPAQKTVWWLLTRQSK